MKTYECSQCGVSASGLIWGFALLARDGWGVAPATNPPGAAERAWLCTDCEHRAEILARGLERLAAPRSERPKSKRLKVLIIDDHVLMLRSLVRMLGGCDTVVTSSPIQALAVLQGGAHFDAIVSDVMMPEMNGTELYVRCFTHSPELAQRFVFASADPVTARHMVAQAVAQVGANHAPALISKPTSRALLMSAVTSAAASTAHDSGTYFMRFPSRLWPETGEAKDPRVATLAPSQPTRRGSGGFR
jgi:CheY-like chemotaxis protein